MASLRIFYRDFPHLVIRCDRDQILEIRWENSQNLARTKNCRALPAGEKDLFTQIRKDLARYFSGEEVDWDWPLNWSQGTKFQQRVWKALQRIPYGETRSYQWLARAIGKPKAIRAVGQANKRNPFPIIAPCHRVIAKDGSIGGYAAGLQIKRKLLALEKSSLVPRAGRVARNIPLADRAFRPTPDKGMSRDRTRPIL